MTVCTHRHGVGALVALLFAPLAVAEYTCDEPWPDFCDGTPDLPGCSAYVPLPPETDWRALRARLVDEIFQIGDGKLPSTKEPREFRQAPCSEFGDCPQAPEARVWRAVWDIVVPVNASFSLALHSSGFLSPAAAASPAASPHLRKHPSPQHRKHDTLVIFHSGHYAPCDRCAIYDDDGAVQWLNAQGYDVMHLHMPLYMCNHVASIKCDHRFFEQFQGEGAPVFRFFLEPVILAVNFALGALNYKHVAMVGLSGGGWTTTVAGALDPRIALSMPVAGSIPCDFRHTAWDFEQQCSQPWARIANYTSLYVLAALEPSRASVQVLHEADPCCFHACLRHGRIADYNAWVAAQAAGHFATNVTDGNRHWVSPADREVIAAALGRFVEGAFDAAPRTRPHGASATRGSPEAVNFA